VEKFRHFPGRGENCSAFPRGLTVCLGAMHTRAKWYVKRVRAIGPGGGVFHIFHRATATAKPFLGL